MKIQAFVVIALMSALPTLSQAKDATPEQIFSDIAKQAGEDIVGNGEARTFKFNEKKFEMADAIKDIKAKTRGFEGCKFVMTIGRTENIQKLKTDDSSLDDKSSKKIATVLEKMRKENQLVTIINMKWDGVESENVSGENCGVSIYDIYGTDGSGLTLDMEATD